MRNRIIIGALALLLLLAAGCKKNTLELPLPTELYEAIAEKISLPDMVSMPSDLFPEFYGIGTGWFEEAVSYTCIDIMRPDEIVIIRAVSEEAASAIIVMLEMRLEYKEKSAANYFAETVKSIHDGEIRQDGMTVSLLVSQDIKAIIKLYETYR